MLSTRLEEARAAVTAAEQREKEIKEALLAMPRPDASALAVLSNELNQASKALTEAKAEVVEAGKAVWQVLELKTPLLVDRALKVAMARMNGMFADDQALLSAAQNSCLFKAAHALSSDRATLSGSELNDIPKLIEIAKKLEALEQELSREETP
jgi:light-regulated signal transduction histidine kinase (bacteriophytochrome)